MGNECQTVITSGNVQLTSSRAVLPAITKVQSTKHVHISIFLTIYILTVVVKLYSNVKLFMSRTIRMHNCVTTAVRPRYIAVQLRYDWDKTAMRLRYRTGHNWRTSARMLGKEGCRLCGTTHMYDVRLIYWGSFLTRFREQQSTNVGSLDI